MRFNKYTATGSRKGNEDSHLVIEWQNCVIAGVADGVGGLDHGRFASQFVVEEFEKYCTSISKPVLETFLVDVNSRLIDAAVKRFGETKIATTFTGGIITDSSLRGVHVGDSRVCVLRGNGIKQLTEEHTEFGRLVREGKIKLTDRKYYRGKNILERAVGHTENFGIQTFAFDLLPGDRVLFSTDGFHETLSKEEIRDISIRYKSLNEFNRRLVIELDNRILLDNTTFICIEV